jgi:23S rRNA pseudouridine1911/1915/1917 synthase
MEKKILQVHEEGAGQRADVWLTDQLEPMTRSAVQRLLAEGQVLREGRTLTKNSRLSDGDCLEITLPDPEPADVLPQNIPLDIVYEDEDVIVVNKPKGLVVHPAPGHPDGTLVNALMYHCGDSLSGIGGELRPGIVHRIDRDTSGLLIAAKNDAAHQKLAAQLQDHTLARTYHCIVTGRLREDSGTVNAPIGRHPVERKKMAVVANGRPAVTHWTVLERFPGFTYVECRLETGRTHQIRVHMAYLGHPIWGDTVYGGKKPVPGLQGQCLHAVGLRFLHPRTGEPVELHCGLPEEFQAKLRSLRAKNG